MSAAGGFSFSNAVTLLSTLIVTLATTCSALSCTGFTCTGNISWGGVTYVAPNSATGGNTYPTLLSIKTDGVTEVGKYLDFHSASAQTAEDFLIRLTATAGVLDCIGSVTRLQHHTQAYMTTGGSLAASGTAGHLFGRSAASVTGRSSSRRDRPDNAGS